MFMYICAALTRNRMPITGYHIMVKFRYLLKHNWFIVPSVNIAQFTDTMDCWHGKYILTHACIIYYLIHAHSLNMCTVLINMYDCPVKESC